MISLTEIATKKILEKLHQRGYGLGIRIGVKPSGCNGYKYILEYADRLQEHDTVVKLQGVNIYIDSASLPYLENLTIDWQQQGLNQGFEFLNPKETSRCGCGQSFSVTPAAE